MNRPAYQSTMAVRTGADAAQSMAIAHPMQDIASELWRLVWEFRSTDWELYRLHYAGRHDV